MLHGTMQKYKSTIKKTILKMTLWSPWVVLTFPSSSSSWLFNLYFLSMLIDSTSGITFAREFLHQGESCQCRVCHVSEPLCRDDMSAYKRHFRREAIQRLWQLETFWQGSFSFSCLSEVPQCNWGDSPS